MISMSIGLKSKAFIYWGISFISVFVVLLSVYYFLGGFQDISKSRSVGAEYSIAGKWLSGERSRKEEAILFNEVRDLVASKTITGTLCMVDYRHDSLDEKQIRRFIGVLLTNQVSAIPPGFKVLELEATTTYQASLTMHPLVMPNAEKVVEDLQKMATENNDLLDDFTVELYFEDNSVIVEKFVKS